MQCWNNRILNKCMQNSKTRQRYQPYLLDYCLKASKERKQTLEDLLEEYKPMPL